MTTIPHPPALQLAARIGRDATLLQVSIIGLASDLDNSAFFTKNLKPLIKNLKPRERLHQGTHPLLAAYPYTQIGSVILNHPLALEVAETTEWILGGMQCAGSLAFF